MVWLSFLLNDSLVSIAPYGVLTLACYDVGLQDGGRPIIAQLDGPLLLALQTRSSTLRVYILSFLPLTAQTNTYGYKYYPCRLWGATGLHGDHWQIEKKQE